MKKIIFSIFLFIIFGVSSAHAANNGNGNGNGNGDTGTGTVEETEIVKVMFFEQNNDGSTGEKINTENVEGVIQEDIFNNFIKKSVSVFLYYKKGEEKKLFKKVFDENTSGVVNIDAVISESKTITRQVKVIRINKQSPTGVLKYSPSNNTWVNSSKTVTLEGAAAGEDWLVGNSKPSYKCEEQGGCIGKLSIQDSAGNVLELEYNIQKIDKINPTIHVTAYPEIASGKQKIGYRCEDLGGSGCKNGTDEKIDYLPTGSSKIYCIEDNAGNSSCQKVTAANSDRDYSDDHLAHTNDKRKLFLKCIDNFSGCTTPAVIQYRYKNIASTNLTIKDNAGNSYTKVFQISKIDKVKPSVTITSPNSFKATDDSRINVSFNDNVPTSQINDYSESGIKEAKYKWNSSCKSGNNIIGTSVINGENINYTVAGNHKLYLCAIDNSGNIGEVIEDITIYPGDIDLEQSSVFPDTTNDKYANFKDYYLYNLQLKDKYGNPIFNKEATEVKQKCDDSSCKTLFLDMVDTTLKDDALIEYDFANKTNVSGILNFKIKSYTPGIFSDNFYFKLRDWNDSYNDIGFPKEYYLESNENSFLKPIEGKIEILEGGNIPEIGKEQKYKINLINTGSLTNYNSGDLKVEKDSIVNQVEGHFWNEFKDEKGYFGDNIGSDSVGFIGKIDANKNILKGPQIKAHNLEIKYNLFGQNIRYYLDSLESAQSCDLETLGAKIFGQLQGDGKGDMTGQEENFSDLSIGETRSQIRKNAYSQIATMRPNTTVNGIKYVENQNYVVETNPSYETLVVKNGNVILNKNNINFDNSKLGIIVLKDNYNVKRDFDNTGNVYIANNVEYIGGSIYADGTIRSAKSNGDKYEDLELNKKLELFGNLFTRNTIGGAVLGGTEYTIPGGQITSDFELAEVYDLNYVRKIDKVCSANPEDNYSFVIRYNPSIQTNPPKLFSN